MRISEENLHISAFAIVGDGKGSILLLKAVRRTRSPSGGETSSCPRSCYVFGEWPFAAAKRAVTTQLDGADSLEPKFREIQSYWEATGIFASSTISKGGRRRSFRQDPPTSRPLAIA